MVVIRKIKSKMRKYSATFLHVMCTPFALRQAMDGDQGRCRIAEVVQYMCDLQKAGSSSEIVCFPLPRLFRL